MAQRAVRACLVLCAAALGFAARPEAQDRPLPDRERFVEQVRERLLTIDTALHRYAFQITRREQSLDQAGRPTDESVKVYESYPGLPGEERWERLIAEDGQPVSDTRLAAQDRKREEAVRDAARRRTGDADAAHEKQTRAWEDYQRDLAETIDDIFHIYDIRMLGRESIGGHETIAFSLTPRADADPRTDSGARMRNFAIRAWASEADHELVRVDAELLRVTTVWWGLLARVHAGSTVSYERRKVSGEDWLPARFHYRGSARVGLIRVVRQSVTLDYSAYRQIADDPAQAR